MLVMRSGGFSVIELMIVIAIVGILASIAAPSFHSITATSRVKTVASDIHLSLTRARSEAVKRNASITVAAPSGWLGGWTVSVSGGGETVETHGAIPGDILTVNGTTSITYTPNGRATPVNISLSSTATNTARCISIALNGQPIIKQEACPS